MLPFFLFLLGLLVGSFLNVVIGRLPRDEGIVRGRSHCPKCRHDLGWADLVPLLSFLWLRGRCRYCGERISLRYPVVELITGFLFVVMGVESMSQRVSESMTLTQASIASVDTLTLLTLSAILIAIAVIDLERGIIPDRLVYPGIVLAVAYRLLVAGLGGDVRSLLWTSAGSAIIFVSFYLLHVLFKGRAMGGGDVKLAALVGLVTGWPLMLVAIFSSFLTGAAAGVILMMFKKKSFGETMPFGPFLVLATFITLFFGHQIIDWYWGFL